jgi:hypothetical protein
MFEIELIEKLTKEFLHGEIYKISMRYLNSTTLRLCILYIDSNECLVEYDVNLCPSSRLVQFENHFYYNDNRVLDPNPNFHEKLGFELLTLCN